MATDNAAIVHSSLCALHTTGHMGPCTCGADPKGLRGIAWLLKTEPKK